MNGLHAKHADDGLVILAVNVDQDRALNFSLTVDSLTGATPNGAVLANTLQTFTGASGNKSYTVQSGELPLDPTEGRHRRAHRRHAVAQPPRPDRGE